MATYSRPNKVVRTDSEIFSSSRKVCTKPRVPLQLLTHRCERKLLWVTPYGQQQGIDVKQVPFTYQATPQYIENSVDLDKCMNKALERFDNGIGSMQQWAVDWAERKKAINLATVQSVRLLRMVRAIASRNPRQLLKAFGVEKSNIKNIPNLWIEYNFGIKPTIRGIHDAMLILGQPFPAPTVRGKASREIQRPVDYAKVKWLSGKLTCKVSGKIVAINPEKYLFSQTGLANPLSMGWELIPWSWAVDYFTNINQWLLNFQPRHPGVTIKDSYRTWAMECQIIDTTEQPTTNTSYPTYAGMTKEFGCHRMPGLPSYKLVPPSLEELSTRRLSLILSAIVVVMRKGKN